MFPTYPCRNIVWQGCNSQCQWCGWWQCKCRGCQRLPCQRFRDLFCSMLDTICRSSLAPEFGGNGDQLLCCLGLQVSRHLQSKRSCLLSSQTCMLNVRSVLEGYTMNIRVR